MYITFLNMQQVRSNRESIHETTTRSGGGGSSGATRTEISSLVNDHSNAQRLCM